jgi:hypothetical protein
MGLVVFESAQRITPATVRGLAHSCVRERWNGTLLPSPLWWVMAVDPQFLWFGGSLPGGGSRVSHARAGEYCEGLWEGDVFELFLKEPGGRYLELNISPEGAWWAMEHTSYRTRVPYLRPPKVVHLDTEVLEGRWSALIGLERDSLPFPVTPSMKVHVSGIVYGGETVYISSHSVPTEEPDFHREEVFQGISSRSI